MAKRGRKAKLETREEIEKARGKSTIRFVKSKNRSDKEENFEVKTLTIFLL